jgi:hypothetical protein
VRGFSYQTSLFSDYALEIFDHIPNNVLVNVELLCHLIDIIREGITHTIHTDENVSVPIGITLDGSVAGVPIILINLGVKPGFIGIARIKTHTMSYILGVKWFIH